MDNTPDIRLTQYSHGAGCGCKISPKILDKILHSTQPRIADPRLLVGNETRDDAAVYDMGNGIGLISTTDFFMPIVDDPFDFGRIAATNAISDVYAMGGKPLMAIAILGWPISVLPIEAARQVIEGARDVCTQAGISLAGGHSIDSPEPVFGLAVTGQVKIDHIKKNSTAKAGSELFLTKPLGIGVLTTAEKKKRLQPEHQGLATAIMCQLNSLGAELSAIAGVTAMTDITGFGFLGHLSEMCQGSGLHAQIYFDQVPTLPGTLEYIQRECVPGGTARNFDSYGTRINPLTPLQRDVLCDPQTSGGLLLAVLPESVDQVRELAKKQGITLYSLGKLQQSRRDCPLIEVIASR